MNQHSINRVTKSITLLSFIVAAGFAASSAQAEIDPAARAVAKAMSDKLAAAQTIRLAAKHQIDPSLGVGSKIEKGPLNITVKRPNRFYALQPAGEETREIAFDGTTLCLMRPQLGHHALEPLKAATIEQFADRVDEKFGFRPPVTELLAGDAAAQLFLNVTSARVVGTERLGWTSCKHLRFEQDGIVSDLWVGVKDNLPRRYLLTFTSEKGNPTWDIKLSKWELNVPVDDRLFTKRPAAGSNKVKMYKSR
jgi:hypothetical protein